MAGAAGALGATPLSAAAPHSWNYVLINGLPYVSAQDIMKNFGFREIKRSGRQILFHSKVITMTWNLGGDDIFLNKFKFCLSHPIIESNGRIYTSALDLEKLISPILRPTHIGVAKDFNTIVIDPGHGGDDSGANGYFGVNEKDYALDTSLRLKRLAERIGFRTVLTRSTDVFIERPERVRIANAVPQSIFISIHYNSFSSSSVGIETFALAPAGTPNTDKELRASDLSRRNGNESDSENIALATGVHCMAVKALGGTDRGVKRERFTVLTGLTRPAILVEGGFLSNRGECARVHRPEYRECLAKAILDGVSRYRLAITKSKTKTRATANPRVPVRRL